MTQHKKDNRKLNKTIKKREEQKHREQITIITNKQEKTDISRDIQKRMKQRKHNKNRHKT